jgi:hypothetical protein
MYTRIREYGFGRMITFDIKFSGQLKDISGTILHAKAAPFTSITDNMDFTMWHFDLVRIERFTPILHSRSPVVLLLIIWYEH